MGAVEAREVGRDIFRTNRYVPFCGSEQCGVSSISYGSSAAVKAMDIEVLVEREKITIIKIWRGT